MVAAQTRPEAGDCSLLEIVRSHRPVGLLFAGAGLLALGSLLVLIGFATLTEHSFRTTHDLLHAAAWLSFAAVLTGLAAVGEGAWAHLVRRGWVAGAELAGAAGASLLIAIGFLLVAASPDASSATGAVLAAIGLGGWLVVLLYNGARRAMAEQAAGAPAHQSDLWLVAAAAVLFLAVGTGLPSPSGDESALAIATQVLFVVGFATLAVALELGMRRGQITDRRVGVVEAGLAVLALSRLAEAISAGYVFSPSATLTTTRVGLSIPAFLEIGGWAVLAWAALGRRLDLAGPTTKVERPARGWRLFGSPTGSPPAETEPPGPGPGPPPSPAPVWPRRPRPRPRPPPRAGRVQPVRRLPRSARKVPSLPGQPGLSHRNRPRYSIAPTRPGRSKRPWTPLPRASWSTVGTRSPPATASAPTAASRSARQADSGMAGEPRPPDGIGPPGSEIKCPASARKCW